MQSEPLIQAVMKTRFCLSQTRYGIALLALGGSLTGGWALAADLEAGLAVRDITPVAHPPCRSRRPQPTGGQADHPLLVQALALRTPPGTALFVALDNARSAGLHGAGGGRTEELGLGRGTVAADRATRTRLLC
jgi:hypothetical protein